LVGQPCHIDARRLPDTDRRFVARVLAQPYLGFDTNT